MNIKDYFFKTWRYILFFIVVIFIVNINILIDVDITISKDSLLYMNFIILFIGIIFFVYDFYVFKRKNMEIETRIANCDMNDIDIKISREYRGIVEAVDRVNIDNMEKIESLKSEIKEFNDYVTDWVHQIKIPISILEIMSERLEDKTVSKSMRIELKRIDSLVEKVMYISRSGNYSSDFSFESVNIGKIVRDVIKKNRYMFIIKNIEIDLKDMNVEVITDRKWISHIFEIILDNACKYSHEGGKIEIYSDTKDKRVDIHFKDYGEGISISDIGRVFEKGFTGKNGRNRFKSTGMGLYVAKKILNAMGSDIKVESIEGNYCDITIEISNIAELNIYNN